MKPQKPKDLEVAFKQPTCKLAKELEKEKKISDENKKLHKENSRLKQSNKEKDITIENCRARNLTKTNKIKHLKRLVRGESKPAGHQFSCVLIILCVLIRVRTGCSYRNISTILEILQEFFDLPDEQIPCANTIQNWTEKVGYNMLETGDKSFLGTTVAAIIDESLQIGDNKMLLILFTPSEKTKQEALSFSDVRVGYIGYSKSWKADEIASALKASVKKFDLTLSHVVGDECPSIKKAAYLAGVEHLPDISHAIGTCIRKSHSNETFYTDFTKLVSSYQCKGVNQSLSYLIPPSQRTKARFMNQHAMVDWAMKMIARFDTLNENEQAFFKDLLAHQKVVKSLSNCLEISQKVSLWLKKEGFSMEIYDRIQHYLANIIAFDACQENFITHLRSYIERYSHSFKKIFLQEQKVDAITEKVDSITEKRAEDTTKRANSLWNKCIGVCSVIIESLFGKQKYLSGNNKFTGVSSVALELPLLTLSLSQLRKEIIPSIEKIKLSKIKQWKGSYNIQNQAVKRSDFFKNQQKKSNL